MDFEDLKIFEWIRYIIEEIDTIDNTILKGLSYIALFLIGCYLFFYLFLWKCFIILLFNGTGHWILGLIILGVWVIIEFAHLLGGGHNKP